VGPNSLRAREMEPRVLAVVDTSATSATAVEQRACSNSCSVKFC
jgi:hypothetical protein